MLAFFIINYDVFTSKRVEFIAYVYLHKYISVEVISLSDNRNVYLNFLVTLEKKIHKF
jgi:hypothetical protein